MNLIEFRVGTIRNSLFYMRKWTPFLPQVGDHVRLNGLIYRVIDRYIGMDDHTVIFLENAFGVSANQEWVFPKKRSYNRR